MGTVSFGGTASNNARTDRRVSSGGIGFPVGRTAANGKGPIIIWAIQAYASGLGGGRTCHMTLGPARTSNFNIGSSGSAQSTGNRGCSGGYISNGGSGTLTLYFSGMSWFAHGGGGSTTDSYGTNLSGALGGSFSYNEVPSAPTSPAVTVSGRNAVVTWSAPVSSGGANITGYNVQYATNSTFTTGKGTVSVGNVGKATISGLTSGSTYWFRVFAKNSVTAAAGTTSVASSSVSAAVGDWSYDGSHSWKAQVTNVGTAPNWINLGLFYIVPAAALDKTVTYSASIAFDFAPAGGAHSKPLLVQSYVEFVSAGGVQIGDVIFGSSLNISSGTHTFSWSNITIPGGTNLITIEIRVPSLNSFGTQNLALNDVIYADAAMFNNGSSTAYFDGDSSGASWNGTANNSTSSKVIAPTVAFYDAYKDNNIIYTIGIGEISSVAVQTTNFASQLFAPTCTDAGVPALGTYAITDTNGDRVTAALWNSSGAKVVPTIDPDTPGLINLQFIGPKYNIAGFAPPFNFSTILDANNTNATLTILGAGVITNPTTINLLTGANPVTTPADVTATLDSPFITDMGTLYDAGVWAAVDAAGPVLSIQFTVATKTLDGFGLTAGAIVYYQNANWRITDVNIGDVQTVITAAWYTTMGDLDSAWSGQLLGAKDVVWTGYEFADQLIEPLKTA